MKEGVSEGKKGTRGKEKENNEGRKKNRRRRTRKGVTE